MPEAARTFASRSARSAEALTAPSTAPESRVMSALRWRERQNYARRQRAQI